MKIHHLTMTGFGPYKSTETVDFDAFNDEGLFLITGKTGAGKTSILDAITFALFGNVPRYGSATDDRVRSKFVIDTHSETRVDLEFSQGENRYRVSRTPSYTKPGNKNSTATWAEIVRLHADGTEETLASRKVSDVGERVAEIVRLNAVQFKQVILLAQGAFQEFLLAKSEDRRLLLRQLFDSGRFLDYTVDLEGQAKELRGQISHIGTAVKAHVHTLATEFGEQPNLDFEGTERAQILAWAEPLAAKLAEQVEQAKVEVATAEKIRSEAEQAFNSLTALASQQQRLAEAQAKEAELAARDASVDQQRLTLAAAIKADAVWATVEAQHAAETHAQSAATAHAGELREFTDMFPDVDTSAETLVAQAKELADQSARLTDVVVLEQQITVTADRLEQLRDAVADIAQDRQALAQTLQGLLDGAPLLKAQIEEASKRAAGLTQASQTQTALEAQLDSAREIELLDAELEQARTADLAARRECDEASRALTDVKAAEYGQYAGVLAGGLIDGEPCLVCGSLVHPHPATLPEGHVTAEQVDVAEALVTAKREQQVATAEVITRLTTQREAAVKSAQNESVATLEPKVALARQERELVELAAATRDSLLKQQESEVEKIEAAKEALSEANVLLTKKQGEEKALLDEHSKNLAKVTKARGVFETVSERQNAVDSHHALVESLLEATRALAKATSDLESAEQACVKELAARGFADVDAVKRARIENAEQDELTRLIKEHDEARAVVESILSEETLQDLPAEPVETDPARVAYEDAKVAKSQADQTFGEVNRLQTSTTQILKEIKSAFDECGTAQARYETVNRLAQTLDGQGPNTKRMTLETFALAADLEEIVSAANVLLTKMTNGRYELRYTDEITKGRARSGLGLEVIDAYNDESRPPESLSGGEKFQASLALALGLAEVVTNQNGGVRLDTLFIDEGFGALDEDTLGEVLDTIDTLREGGRTVGLISHVDKVKERIHNHINVNVTSEGWSTLE